MSVDEVRCSSADDDVVGLSGREYVQEGQLVCYSREETMTIWWYLLQDRWLMVVIDDKSQTSFLTSCICTPSLSQVSFIDISSSFASLSSLASASASVGAWF